MNFKFESTVKMYDTDAAGILYFASQFRFVHDTWEAFLNSKDVYIHDLIQTSNFMFVIAHAESDYLGPIFLGDRLETELSIDRIGKSSVTFSYQIRKKGELVGRAKTVHVSIDPQTRQSIPLPKMILDKL